MKIFCQYDVYVNNKGSNLFSQSLNHLINYSYETKHQKINKPNNYIHFVVFDFCILPRLTLYDYIWITSTTQ